VKNIVVAQAPINPPMPYVLMNENRTSTDRVETTSGKVKITPDNIKK